MYRLAHGCSYSTVGDLFGVASSRACQIFSEVIRVIVQVFYDEYVTLPTTEGDWKAKLDAINQSINQSFILTSYVKELKNSFKIRTYMPSLKTGDFPA